MSPAIKQPIQSLLDIKGDSHHTSTLKSKGDMETAQCVPMKNNPGKTVSLWEKGEVHDFYFRCFLIFCAMYCPLLSALSITWS